MVRHNKKEVILEFNLPEFSRKDIKINLKENSAEISAEKSLEKKTEKKDFFHHEKISKTFHYMTTIPKINNKKVKIEFKNGLLKIVATRE